MAIFDYHVGIAVGPWGWSPPWSAWGPISSCSKPGRWMVPKGKPKDIIHDSFNLGALKTKKNRPHWNTVRIGFEAVIALDWLAYLASTQAKAHWMSHHPITVAPSHLCSSWHLIGVTSSTSSSLSVLSKYPPKKDGHQGKSEIWLTDWT